MEQSRNIDGQIVDYKEPEELEKIMDFSLPDQGVGAEGTDQLVQLCNAFSVSRHDATLSCNRMVFTSPIPLISIDGAGLRGVLALSKRYLPSCSTVLPCLHNQLTQVPTKPNTARPISPSKLTPRFCSPRDLPNHHSDVAVQCEHVLASIHGQAVCRFLSYRCDG